MKTAKNHGKTGKNGNCLNDNQSDTQSDTQPDTQADDTQADDTQAGLGVGSTVPRVRTLPLATTLSAV